MKNITVSVPQEVYRRARVRAAREETSVSRVVGEYLRQWSDEDSDFERKKKIQDAVFSEIEDFSGADRLSRDAIHERHAVR